MQLTLKKYLHAFGKKMLRMDRAHGLAPHKPILLLSVLQSIEKKRIHHNRIFITPELVSLFKVNWNKLVTTSHECKFALPFYHLNSDKFWKLVPNPGFENILGLSSSLRSFSNLNAAVNYAVLENDLWVLLNDSSSNLLLQDFLLEEYFPITKYLMNKADMTDLQMLEDIENNILYESPEDYKNEIKLLIKNKDEEAIFLRGAIFKREIPKIYNNTCCISGLKIDATISVSMIDACHIVPFSISFNDTIKNGISLCPNLHRAFDRGLVGIDENYKVVISRAFVENESNYSIKSFESKQIKLPENLDYFPSKENLHWHMVNTFV